MSGRYGLLATVSTVAAFVSCIVIANWAMLNLGQPNGPGQPHTVPVGFGLHAPSGVIFAGAMLTLRDVVHEHLGSLRTLGVILLTAPLTALVASPGLAAGSTTAFIVAEIGDLVVYARLRRQSRLVAVVGSNVISAALDSAVFLGVAFGASAVVGSSVAMVVGKFEASMAVLVVLEVVRRSKYGSVPTQSALAPGRFTARSRTKSITEGTFLNRRSVKGRTMKGR